MSFLTRILEQAQNNQQTIVLPEGNDLRTLEAADYVVRNNIAHVILLGDVTHMRSQGFELKGAELIDPLTAPDRHELADTLYELRKHKGMTPEDAQARIQEPLYYGTMLVKTGKADGMVCGALHSTSDVLRAALQIIKTAPNSPSVSSFFVMLVPDCDFGQDGAFIFSDCGLEIQPTAERLAHIACASAHSWESLMGTPARVAMLSHSTKGSAGNNPDRNKVVEALELAQSQEPQLEIDGELQLDAAIIPEVAASKAPESRVAGKANVLVFPDLDAGNIGYKLVQRLARAEAYGPITQGLAAPVNDLSRGCSAQDIIGVIGITCVQAIAQKRLSEN